MDRDTARQIVKDKLPEYLSSKGIHNLSKQFRCLNPAHADKHPSMGYVKDKQQVHCLSCGATYDTFDLIGIDYGLSEDKDIFDKAYSYFGIEIDSYNTAAAGNQKQSKTEQKKAYDSGQGNSSIDDFTDDQQHDFTDIVTAAHEELLSNPEAIAYLTGRGISRELIDAYRIGYHAAGHNDLLKATPDLQSKSQKQQLYKYVLPYIDEKGSSTYFITEITDRSQVDEWNGKYRKLNNAKAPIFNERYLKADTPEVIFVCEGIYDALSIEEVGGKAIALVGVGQRRFLSICKSYKPAAKFILCLDNDGAGSTAIDRIKEGLDTLKLPYDVFTAAQGKDANENLQTDRAQFTEYVQGIIADVRADIEQEQAAEQERKLAEYNKTNASTYLSSFLDEMRKPENTTFYPTGITALDNLIDGGLYKGLYFIGAISSLGKTTFTLQLCDNMAHAGYDVLIFSLEMDKYELMSKSISRYTYMESMSEYGNSRYAKTTRGLMTGSRYESYTRDEMRVIEKAIEHYSIFAKHIFIHEGIGDIGVQMIRDKVQQHKDITGKAPIVLIDYIQILAAYDDSTHSDKEKTDKNVLELKRLSRDFNIPVIGISSFNRENYTAPVSLSSFKESGSIEYSSDVLIGLQYEGMDWQDGEKDDDRKKRIKQLTKDNEQKGKNGQSQSIQVKVLKNRNGSKGDCCIDFYPMFNYFADKHTKPEKLDDGFIQLSIEQEQDIPFKPAARDIKPI